MRPRGCALAGRGRRHGPQQPSGHNGDGGNGSGTLHRRSPLDRCRRWDAVMPVMVASRSSQTSGGRWGLPGTAKVFSETSTSTSAANRRQNAAARGFSFWNGIAQRHPGRRANTSRAKPPATPRPRAERLDEELAHQPLARGRRRAPARSRTARRRAGRGTRPGVVHPRRTRGRRRAWKRPSGPGELCRNSERSCW